MSATLKASTRTWIDSNPDHFDVPTRKRKITVIGDGPHALVRIVAEEAAGGVRGRRSLYIRMTADAKRAGATPIWAERVDEYFEIVPEALPELIAALQELNAEAERRGWARSMPAPAE